MRTSDVAKNNKFKNDTGLKYAVEDQNDMSTFYDYLPKAKMAK